MNPKFFRNGIVMLVLVVGTAALLFTWIQSSAQPNRSATRRSSNDVSQGKVNSVVQQGDTLTVKLKDGHRAAYTVTVPSVLTDVYPNDMQAAANAGERHPRPADLQGGAGARHLVARPAPDRPAAAASSSAASSSS